MTPQQFKQIRLDIGLTMPQLAKELCVSRTTIWRYENGHRAIPALVCKIMERMK
jgi:transcriptional regulator with XRE-family HTH domain